MLTHHFQLSRLVVLSTLLWLLAVPSPAQTSVDAFRKALREQANFSAQDFFDLEQDKIAARLLPVKDKREVGVCGVVRLPVPAAEFLQFTRDNVAQRNNRAILQIGKFSTSPAIEDLQALTLEDRDVDDLRRCTAGDCKVKLSAAMIERLHNEVNWNAVDYRVQATLVFRQMLLDYVRDYLSRGASALMEYSDRAGGVNLAEEQSSLLDASAYFNQFAPEFTGYLRNFPTPVLAGAENYIFWSKLKFGLKPVISITHVVIYPRPAHSAPQVLVASKQIYADHYFDSSLALSAFVSFPAAGETRDSYLLYTNRSRADALGGLFSGLKRSMVESEALGSLQTILQEQKLKLEAGSAQPASSQPGTTVSNSWRDWRPGGLHPLWWVLAAISIVVLAFWLVRRTSRRRHKPE